MPQPIVIYDEFVKAYTRKGFKMRRDPKLGRVVPMLTDCLVPPMGTFRWGLLTKDGEAVLDILKSFHLPAPKYRGVSKVAVYFKWNCSVHVTREKAHGKTTETKHSTSDALLVAADKIREMGYDVTVEYCPRENKNESMYECGYCGREKQGCSSSSCRCQSWLPMMVRKGPAVVDQYKMVIKHPPE